MTFILNFNKNNNNNNKKWWCIYLFFKQIINKFECMHA